MPIDVCLSPALYPFYHHPHNTVVVVDIFRATSTLVAAFEAGARCIRPVATLEEAEAHQKKGWLAGAERQAKRCDFADFGNSPFDYTPHRVAHKNLVFTTTNGTQAIQAARAAAHLCIGAFVNLEAVANHCMQRKSPLVILCSGWENRVNLEDTFFCGALVERLNKQQARPLGDGAAMAVMLWQQAKSDWRNILNQAEHVQRLHANGCANDIAYCLSLNQSALVPIYSPTENKLTIQTLHEKE